VTTANVCLHREHAALAEKGVVFNAPAQLQRGGLLLLDGVAYAGYGGNNGDCQECECQLAMPAESAGSGIVQDAELIACSAEAVPATAARRCQCCSPQGGQAVRLP